MPDDKKQVIGLVAPARERIFEASEIGMTPIEQPDPAQTRPIPMTRQKRIALLIMHVQQIQRLTTRLPPEYQGRQRTFCQQILMLLDEV